MESVWWGRGCPCRARRASRCGPTLTWRPAFPGLRRLGVRFRAFRDSPDQAPRAPDSPATSARVLGLVVRGQFPCIGRRLARGLFHALRRDDGPLNISRPSLGIEQATLSRRFSRPRHRRRLRRGGGANPAARPRARAYRQKLLSEDYGPRHWLICTGLNRARSLRLSIAAPFTAPRSQQLFPSSSLRAVRPPPRCRSSAPRGGVSGR